MGQESQPNHGDAQLATGDEIELAGERLARYCAVLSHASYMHPSDRALLARAVDEWKQATK